MLLTGPQSCDNATMALLPAKCPESRGLGLFERQQNSGYNGSRSEPSISEGLDNLRLGDQIDPVSIFGTNYAVNASLWQDHISLKVTNAVDEIQNLVAVLALASANYWIATIGIGYGKQYWVYDAAQFFIDELGISRGYLESLLGLHCRPILR